MTKRFLISCLCLWSLPLVALAQDDQTDEQMFDENVFTIEGEVQRPDINIFIVKKNLDKAYELKLRESFIPKIKESMKKKPF